jgi:hypothetical protein
VQNARFGVRVNRRPRSRLASRRAARAVIAPRPGPASWPPAAGLPARRADADVLSR